MCSLCGERITFYVMEALKDSHTKQAKMSKKIKEADSQGTGLQKTLTSFLREISLPNTVNVARYRTLGHEKTHV